MRELRMKDRSQYTGRRDWRELGVGLGPLSSHPEVGEPRRESAL